MRIHVNKSNFDIVLLIVLITDKNGENQFSSDDHVIDHFCESGTKVHVRLSIFIPILEKRVAELSSTKVNFSSTISCLHHMNHMQYNMSHTI